MLSTLPIAATLLLSVGAAPAPPREIDNVAAFARLYGVVRFFYPSDAAAELEWNRPGPALPTSSCSPRARRRPGPMPTSISSRACGPACRSR